MKHKLRQAALRVSKFLLSQFSPAEQRDPEANECGRPAEGFSRDVAIMARLGRWQSLAVAFLHIPGAPSRNSFASVRGSLCQAPCNQNVPCAGDVNCQFDSWTQWSACTRHLGGEGDERGGKFMQNRMVGDGRSSSCLAFNSVACVGAARSLGGLVMASSDALAGLLSGTWRDAVQGC